ncbi:MAG: hypothetical protein VYA54_04135 [Bdellovibrionota bacterium]|nr:hypothetical protein [Bdellovibrionota bacterium]
MLQVFFQNLLNNINKGKILLPLILFYSFNSFAQNSPGLFQRFTELLSEQKKLYNKLEAQAQKNSFSVNDINSFSEISLNLDYINLVLFNTPLRYHYFLQKDKCAIYDLLVTDLAEMPDYFKEQIFFTYKNKKGAQLEASMPKAKYFKEIVGQICPGVIKIGQNFETASLRNTLSQLKINYPEKKPQCEEYFKEFRKAVTSPYLCHIIENIENLKKWTFEYSDYENKNNIALRRNLKQRIDRAKIYQSTLSQEAFNKLSKTCTYLDDSDRGCSELFLENYWAFLYKEKPTSAILKTYCGDKVNQQCINTLSTSTYACMEKIHQTSSLGPAANCSQIQQSIKNSRLKSEYIDCPGRSGDETLTTFSRILRHFDFYNTEAVSDCSMNSTHPTADFLKEYTELDTWGLNICYDDKIQKKEVCYPVLFGDVKDREYSLSTVIGKVANKLRGYPYQESPCELIFKDDYKPALLRFKNGCFIIKNDQQCSATNCDIKVIISEREFNNFKIKREITQNLYPYNYIKENLALIKLLERHKKLKLREIQNISSFKAVYESHPEAIFVGVGCAEDLMPLNFQRTKLNQCRPVPFIVDYLIESGGSFSMQVRTSLDHIHAPRVVPWNYVFNSLKEYQAFHPINLWSFNAIYK